MARSNFAPRAAGSFWPWIGWAVFILIIDQLTKTLILGAYRLGDATPGGLHQHAAHARIDR